MSEENIHIADGILVGGVGQRTSYCQTIFTQEEFLQGKVIELPTASKLTSIGIAFMQVNCIGCQDAFLEKMDEFARHHSDYSNHAIYIMTTSFANWAKALWSRQEKQENNI